MAAELKQEITSATKAAMKSRDRERLAVLRLVNAELKQHEIDSRSELDDKEVTRILSRMIKQRRSSIDEFKQGNRLDLAQQEQFEIDVIQSFLPSQLSKGELDEVVAMTCNELNASSLNDMGKVMGRLSNELAGRADMAQVSSLVRGHLQN